MGCRLLGSFEHALGAVPAVNSLPACRRHVPPNLLFVQEAGVAGSSATYATLCDVFAKQGKWEKLRTAVQVKGGSAAFGRVARERQGTCLAWRSRRCMLGRQGCKGGVVKGLVECLPGPGGLAGAKRPALCAVPCAAAAPSVWQLLAPVQARQGCSCSRTPFFMLVAAECQPAAHQRCQYPAPACCPPQSGWRRRGRTRPS